MKNFIEKIFIKYYLGNTQIRTHVDAVHAVPPYADQFTGEIVKHSREDNPNKKIFSLWDSYVYADFVTYPSIWEGFGNQLLEAVFAKLPLVVYEYPVYKADLKSSGFNLVSLGDQIKGKDKNGLLTIEQKKIKSAADKIIELLLDNKKRQQMVNHNYSIAKNNYSYDVLADMISDIFKNLNLE